MYRIKRERQSISAVRQSIRKQFINLWVALFRLQSHLTCMIASDCHNKGMLCIAIAVLFTVHLRAWMAEKLTGIRPEASCDQCTALIMANLHT